MTRRYGWIPDIPDARDFAFAARPRARRARYPGAVNLQSHCPPVRDQGRQGSCGGQMGAE